MACLGLFSPVLGPLSGVVLHVAVTCGRILTFAWQAAGPVVSAALKVARRAVREVATILRPLIAAAGRAWAALFDAFLKKLGAVVTDSDNNLGAIKHELGTIVFAKHVDEVIGAARAHEVA